MIKKYNIIKKKAEILDILLDRFLFLPEGEALKPFCFKIMPKGAVLLIADIQSPDKNVFKSNTITTDPRPLEEKMLDVLSQYLKTGGDNQ